MTVLMRDLQSIESINAYLNLGPVTKQDDEDNNLRGFSPGVQSDEPRRPDCQKR